MNRGDAGGRLRIVAVNSSGELAAVRTLIREYVDWLGIDLSFQNFDHELAGLPGDYAPPEGRLLLALDGDQPAGCVALRKFARGVCEMKRMWVRPQYRGRGWGRLLAVRVIADAEAIGYERMVLDSLASLTSALQLYRSLGFRAIAPYRYNPEPDAVFMQLELDRRRAR